MRCTRFEITRLTGTNGGRSAPDRKAADPPGVSLSRKRCKQRRVESRSRVWRLWFNAQWNNDFRHAPRAVLTGERDGYSVDYGAFHQVVKAYREGIVYSGEYCHHAGAGMEL